MKFLIEIRDGDFWHSVGCLFDDRDDANSKAEDIRKSSKCKARVTEVCE